MAIGIREGAHGFNYDFGVSIARSTVQSLATTVAGVVALTASINGLIDADDELVTMINKNQIAFGGYANTMKALAYAEKRSAEGIGFNTADMIDGFKSLQRAGYNAKKETDLVAKAATGMGTSFADTARIIQTGDFSALAEAGIISQRTAMSYNAMGFSAQAATKHVHALIAEANKKGMFDGAVQSMSAIITRFKQFKNDFVYAIIGDPRDPEGLAFNVKKYMTKIADFLNTHRNTIIYYGKIIGRVFRFVINVVGDFLKTMAKQLFHVDQIREKSVKTMQDQLLSFGLWIEILRVKIKMFFEEYGKYIAFAIKALLAFKAIKIGLGMWRGLNNILQFTVGFLGEILPSLKLVYRYLKYVSFVKWGSFTSGISSMATGLASCAASAWTFTAALLANPITWIVAAVIALVAAVVWLVKNWDELWYKTQSMEDTWYNMLNPLYMIIKYWEEIKATISNVWLTAKGLFSSFYDSIATVFYNVKYDFMKIKKWIYDYVYLPFKSTWDAIGNFFDRNIMQPITNFFKKIGDFLDKYIAGPIARFFGGDNSPVNQKVANLAVNTTKTAGKIVNNGMAHRDAYLKYSASLASGTSKKDALAQLNSDIKTNTERSNALQSSDGVKNKKEQKYVDMTTQKIMEGEPPATAKIKYSADNADIPFGGGSGMGGDSKVYINSGAVQINLGSGSGMDENKLAALIEKKLKQLALKDRIRTQGN